MIFLSHNYLDKVIVEPIAINLSKVFGMENVFYDSWSMQPGEGIIDRMNQGLEECKYFFFFVSKNSLASNMVKLEWQNALYKATQNKVKLIPVKLDDCLMPAILIQTLYIDIYGKGLEYGLSQIIDVINNKNTFNQGVQTYENVRAYFTATDDAKEIELEIRAETYLEPISKYILLVENSENEVKVTSPELLNPTGDRFMKDINVETNYICNGIYYFVNRATVPNFPIRFTLKSTTDTPLKFIGVMKAIGENSVRLIPAIQQ
ncbi:toll/interleukin-1 receptor domain-containing protein [Flavobacterium sp. MDT1-60]|uniref:toll/interleukin-1 receptor domain-containing protein n=1 Tax=Flavobacterium sp. MDT1-60 TaxID=1979344 RepID=UPI001785E753|nr:toll/interleukin-1 receptor domain-containing protein [Flavobacterium sp. MDT1-60]QOG01918.1 toll/interleukin-1 receptor domain-containing protein [Flavobacterium sp. MDT1-60]